MSDPDSISVVVPTYNRARWIARTLSSILDQSVKPLEVIIVDDGSTDDTEAQCEQFGEQVRFVRQPNGGVSRARNHGVSLAQGHWIAFCDSDDVWHREKLAIQLAAVRATEALWSITSAYLLDLADAPLPGRSGFEFIFPVFAEQNLQADSFFSVYLQKQSVSSSGGPVTVFHGDAYPALFLGNFALPSSALVKRTAFVGTSGFDETFRLAEETEFFHRLSAMASVAVCMAPLVGYRIAQSDSMISSANTVRLIRNALQSLRSASQLRPASNPDIASQLRRGEASLLTKLARTELSNGEGSAARRTLRELWAGGGSVQFRHLILYGASMVPSPALRFAYSALPTWLRTGRRHS